MGRPSTGTPIVEHHDSLPLRFLIDRGYLRNGYTIGGSIEWSWCGRPMGSAGLKVMTTGSTALLTLHYWLSGEEIEQQISMIAHPSNLGVGRGQVWYFICPHSGNKCRKLYRVGRYFYSRAALSEAIYQSQAESHRGRLMRPAPDPWPRGKKKLHKGRYTKAYIRHMKAEDDAHRSLIAFAQSLGWTDPRKG